MSYVLKSESEAKEYFEKAARTCSPGSIVLLHNQRKTVLSLLREATQKANKIFIEQDLSVIAEERIGTSRFEDKVPKWLEPAFENGEKSGCILYMREFHFAPEKVKNDALNVIIKREVESFKLPSNTLIVLGLLDTDDMAMGLSGTHIVTFYRKV